MRVNALLFVDYQQSVQYTLRYALLLSVESVEFHTRCGFFPYGEGGIYVAAEISCLIAAGSLTDIHGIFQPDTGRLLGGASLDDEDVEF